MQNQNFNENKTKNDDNGIGKLVISSIIAVIVGIIAWIQGGDSE